MGRSVGGGGGGSFSSSSSHSSSSHSHSSHSSFGGRSTRDSGGFSGSFGGGSFGRPSYRRNTVYVSNDRYYGGYRSGTMVNGREVHGIQAALLWIFMYLFLFAIVAIVFFGRSADIPASTVNREKLDGSAWNASCVEDDIGWLSVDNHKLMKGLQTFWKKTGVQPYIVFHDYDTEITTAEDRYSYADDYFNENVMDETAMLVVYFNDAPGDQGGRGEWECVKGKRVDYLMDTEAMDIFWAYLDKYWYEDYSESEVLQLTFTKTASRIMHKSITIVTFGVIGAAILLVILVIVGVLKIMQKKRENDKAQNEETARILNTPLEQPSDPLVDKYLKKDQ